MKKLLGIVVLGLLLSNSAFADERFEKDLKKISKLNSFFNNKGEPYQIQKNITKDKTIIIIYTHGSHGKNQKINSCKRAWNKIPPSIYQLDGTKIKDFTIKTYQLCSGVRGFTKKEEDLFWKVYDDNNQDLSKVLELKDKNGVFLIDKHGITKKRKVIKLKIKEFRDEGFKNIVLAGHSAGAWDSLVLYSNFPSEINGVIAFNPARSGKYARKLKKNEVGRWTTNWRNYKISLIKLEKLGKVLVYSHNKDSFETPETLSFLSNSKAVQFIDLSDTSCKGKVKFNKYHGIPSTKCFADKEPKNKYIVKYLEEIF